MLVKLRIELEHLKFISKKLDLLLFHLTYVIINLIRNIRVPLPKIHSINYNSPYQPAITNSSTKTLEKTELKYEILEGNRIKVLENHEYLSSKIASNQHVLFVSFSLVLFFLFLSNLNLRKFTVGDLINKSLHHSNTAE